MKVPDFRYMRERIIVYLVTRERDSELNVIERLRECREVWAAVEVRSAVDDTTPTGERPELKYRFTVRYDKDVLELITNAGKVGYNDKILTLAAPAYTLEHTYIQFDAVEIAGRRPQLWQV